MLFHQGNMFIGTKKGQVLQFDIHKPQKLMKEYDMHTKLNITSLYVDKQDYYGLPLLILVFRIIIFKVASSKISIKMFLRQKLS